MEQKPAQPGQSYGSRILIFAAGFYTLFRLLSVTRNDLWMDEVFSVSAIRQSWAEMFIMVVRDGVHPPLFYILLKLWSLGSESVWWLQLFPFVISILTLTPLYLLCRELNLTLSETAVAFLTIAVNDYFLEYALDLRMYGLLQFFTLFSLWCFIKLQKSDESERATVLLLTFLNLLLVYTHYFGWLIVGLEGLYLLARQRKRVFTFAAGSTGILLCFAPWLWLVVQNAVSGETTGSLDWLTRPSIRDLLWFYTTLNGNLNVNNTTAVNLLLFALPVCFLIWQFAGRLKIPDSGWQILAFFAFAPVLIIFALSYLLSKSVWETRYLIIAAVPYKILLVKSVFALTNKRLRLLFIGFILAWSLIAGFYTFSKTTNKTQWSEAAQKLGRAPFQTDAGTVVYTFDDWVILPLRFYSNELKSPVLVKKQVDFNDIRDRSFWMVFRASMPEKIQAAQEILRSKGCRIEESDFLSDSSRNVVFFYVEDCE